MLWRSHSTTRIPRRAAVMAAAAPAGPAPTTSRSARIAAPENEAEAIGKHADQGVRASARQAFQFGGGVSLADADRAVVAHQTAKAGREEFHHQPRHPAAFQVIDDHGATGDTRHFIE